ncbi:MAG: hypothetical protein LPK19_03725, partial [Hymenobacteraceae bacterium]|nr:hypothetical protein [Hymenobacteraceae bacterium]MDX5511343.1 hypothetical protein [Hymenobacteraceae bacterium]
FFIVDKTLKHSNYKIIHVLTLLVPLLVLVNSSFWLKQFFSHIYEDGLSEYEAKRWKQSETIKYVKKLINKNTVVYSNIPQSIYYRYNEPVQNIYTISKFHLERKLINKSIERISYSSEKPTYLVWFNEDDFSKKIYINKVLEINNFQIVKSFNDGEIYLLKN